MPLNAEVIEAGARGLYQGTHCMADDPAWQDLPEEAKKRYRLRAIDCLEPGLRALGQAMVRPPRPDVRCDELTREQPGFSFVELLFVAVVACAIIFVLIRRILG